jgi:hypothetical protein
MGNHVLLSDPAVALAEHRRRRANGGLRELGTGA